MEGHLVQDMQKHFEKMFCKQPDYIISAPGRINLIGEHVDHQGFSVVPVTIKETINVAFYSEPSSKASLHIHHLDSTLFPSITIENFKDIKPFSIKSKLFWVNYVFAGLFGIVLHKSQNTLKDETVQHINLLHVSSILLDIVSRAFDSYKVVFLYGGTIPVAAGLSSSSALVVASATAFMILLNQIQRLSPQSINPPQLLDISRRTLSEICALSEKYSGTAGGGLDQAAILLSQKECGTHTHFNPLSVNHILLPSSCVFVVCNTCCKSQKAISAGIFYNKRVFELKLGCYILLKSQKYSFKPSPEFFKTLTLSYIKKKFNMSYTECSALANKVLPYKLSREEVCKIMTKSDIMLLLTHCTGHSVWNDNLSFEPLDRVIHVFEEAERVEHFVSICSNTKLTNTEKIQQLGILMNQSNESLMTRFDCGTPELKLATTLAKKFGAAGSKITGAGWGGCTISLVSSNTVDTFLKNMKQYFEILPSISKNYDPLEASNQPLFVVKPSTSTCIFDGKTLSEILWTF